MFQTKLEKETDFLTIDELCALLKLKKHYIYDLTHRRKIPYYKIGRHLRFKLDEIEHWLKSKKSNSN